MAKAKNTKSITDDDYINAKIIPSTGWEALEEEIDAKTEQDDTTEKEGPRKLTKHEKKRKKAEHENEIRKAEKRRIEGALTPTSVEEFEAAVLASPSSSYVWIQYMAFLIGQGDLEGAKALVDRALNTINYREDTEKFNVWVAALNTEVVYGNEDAALALLHRALMHADARKMYVAAVDIFDSADKAALAEDCIKAMCRKHSEDCQVWLRAFRYRLDHQDAAKAQSTLDRALQSLPSSQHVKMISQAALLEFKRGDTERGRGLFENILRNYPRRLDLWSVYIDKEISVGDEDRARALFQRVTHLSLPPKKMKFLFKRWLDWEKNVGGDVKKVKQRAMEFVESTANAAG